MDLLTIDGGSITAVVSPRVGLLVPAGEGTWRLSAGRGFRAPPLAERYVTTTAFGIPVVPNPALRPEKAWAFEGGPARPFGAPAPRDPALFWTRGGPLIQPPITINQ